ncbi:MAG: MazG nucleotide pyrophosphohydrolase [Candidatus Wolfebacteria bacterium GW2011_GWC2_46_275]|uniref:MazG nucleotide pyrophosphohydrolase n=2 Tax=Candidatus Wolfeibacteriota TaxID=1752735 RepID=A0A0G1WFS3_9BACT|nr:MAG: nucleotide pyrophosphohydrolase [Candidatus Wolfebacteria bacterium GW2011_GWB1_47_1]KKU36718.1 MAG: MazG nucleotide pyrophosphohydrolase [Candidatus Wolfebacteria bacterium GW2011_GWC2_46_275]KKU41985.1 MAG: MazG nucleotide pyrophosphohydrolase [Candidatus Wolfebacteria bacterium GW2011_GWB2_46_69]KKU54479.1 MAG: MazG nucleotide pyrophosphohydrolase [Candidatus Wolfebacteria bacterium GW2011_GWC1_47_103]KKU59806.1 MAG: MazG nucleotide pyrophosphohydrolase [Candidatus Wolfebacteria bact
MRYQSYQRKIEELFQSLQWGYWTPLSIMARLSEEIGEVAREINHLHGDKRKRWNEPEGDVVEEIGDVLYTLVCFANANGYNLDRAYWIGTLQTHASRNHSPLSLHARLHACAGQLIEEVDVRYGANNTSQLLSILTVEIKLGNAIRALESLCERLECTMDDAFNASVHKVSVRDRERFLIET